MRQAMMELPDGPIGNGDHVQMPSLREFQPILKKELTNSGMKQYQLAKKTNICTSNLSKILSGTTEAKWYEFTRIIEALSIDFNRAWIAVAILNDPMAYYDTKTQLINSIALNLSKKLPSEGVELVYLKPTLGPAIADMLTKKIVEQEHSISERANSLHSL